MHLDWGVLKYGDLIIIIKVFIQHKKKSGETILSAYTCTHPHMSSTDHTQLSVWNGKHGRSVVLEKDVTWG